ncbi:selenobiotic family radical SAM modification target peptide [Oceanidesulfovibrio marinus]|uniref:Selenobiotic family radical SAM modification target peptide n=1 Tax=Oceanidesulfovibrio marinus TaxID=370038 RepID=A0ABX6NCM3_9BACT|nr:selenobiotic family radical SAM modification target peptide [Oceanidesulfovibrio marinus]
MSRRRHAGMETTADGIGVWGSSQERTQHSEESVVDKNDVKKALAGLCIAGLLTGSSLTLAQAASSCSSCNANKTESTKGDNATMDSSGMQKHDSKAKSSCG